MQGEWLRAVNVIAHPEWNPALTLQAGGGLPAHDIGLVILEKDVPAPYTPVAIADESLSVQVSLPVTIVGYGVTRSRRNNNTGTLRQVTVPLKKIDTHAQLLGVGAFMRGACAGDSGGPMYIRGEDKKWSVIGVTSAGTEIFQNCIGLDNTFTDARAYKKWIESSLAENGLAIKNQ
jgi:secreted trypsin-like serine protease